MLKTSDVYLRKLEESDLERCHKWMNEPEIFLMMGVFAPRSHEDQEAWFSSIRGSRTNLVFALCTTEDDRHIGNVSLFNVDARNRNAGLTIFLADRQVRGGGRGSQAISLLCEYAFNYLNLHRLYCKTDNPVAARMYEKLGFVKEGVLREQSFQCGEYVDKWQYGLLAREFKPVHEISRHSEPSA